MVIRVVVTVLLAAALVGAVLPTVDTAREDHAAALARDELVDLRASSAEFIAENDPPPPGVAGPSLLVTVRVPDGVTLRVGIGPRGESLAWQQESRTGRVEMDIPFASPLTLREQGRHRLRLTLVRADGVATLRVRRHTVDPRQRGHTVISGANGDPSVPTARSGAVFRYAMAARTSAVGWDWKGPPARRPRTTQAARERSSLGPLARRCRAKRPQASGRGPQRGPEVKPAGASKLVTLAVAAHPILFEH
jgi:hypothetical protein